MKNPYANRWMDLHSKERNRGERALARMEAVHAEGRETETCGKCGGVAYYRPGVGAHQCVECGAIRSYKGDWR